MQRSTAALLGLSFVAALFGVILFSHSSPKKRPLVPALKPSASVIAPAAPAASAGLRKPDAGPDSDAAAPFTEGFETFPDGGKVPDLPDSAPKDLTFGVIQFSYQGAQFAPSDARQKAQARQKADAALELAKRDFAAAVAQGDRGSTADAGRIPRGVLEAPIEFVLFLLKKNTVAPEVIDTPRGYWILRRND